MNVPSTVKLLGAILVGVIWMIGMIYVVSSYLP